MEGHKGYCESPRDTMPVDTGTDFRTLPGNSHHNKRADNIEEETGREQSRVKESQLPSFPLQENGEGVEDKGQRYGNN